MKDLLSIFIPTYNRASVLDSILEKVIEAVYKESISIHISDNSSTDNTKEVVKKWQNQYPYITYDCNKENIGADRNMLKIIDYNVSKYVLMLGDDDYITNNFLEEILPYLENDYKFIVLGTNSNYPTQIYHTADEAFDFLYDKMPYGSLIMRTNIITRQIIDKYIGTYHAYSAMAWEAFALSESVGKAVYYNEKQVVVLGQGGKTWSSSAIDVFLYGIPQWFSLLPINPTIKAKVYRRHKKMFFKIKVFAIMKIEANVSNLTSFEFFTVADRFKWFVVKVTPSLVIKTIKKIKSFIK